MFLLKIIYKMGRYSVPSWLKHLSSIKRAHFWWDPEKTDQYLRYMEEKNKEWETPPWIPITLHTFRGIRYTLDMHWVIRWENWKVMKCNIRWKKPRVKLRIEKKDSKWNFIKKQEEFSILSLMEKYYWKYIKWYAEQIKNPDEYELVPIDWNLENMNYDNLQYRKKTTRWRLIQELSDTLSINGIAKQLHTTREYVLAVLSKIETENPEYNRRKAFETKYWIRINEKSIKIYEKLIESWWILKDIEISRLLRWHKIDETEDKTFYTGKVLRARMKLEEKWIIQKLKEQKIQRKSAMNMINNMANSHFSFQEIADRTWLSIKQVELLSKVCEMYKKS